MYANLLTSKQKKELFNLDMKYDREKRELLDKIREAQQEQLKDIEPDSLYALLLNKIKGLSEPDDLEQEIIGCSIDIELLKEYNSVECIRCHYCNNGDPRESIPIMVWTSNYFFLFSHYPNEGEIQVYSLDWWAQQNIPCLDKNDQQEKDQRTGLMRDAVYPD